MSDSPVEKLVGRGKYKCPSCDNTVEVFVRLSELPLCCNHTTGKIQMLKLGRGDA
jgi:hypothetical protein